MGKNYDAIDFKLFLANEENKRQLCQLLMRVWGSEVAGKRVEKATRAVVVVEGKAYDLESTDGEVRIVQEPGTRNQEPGTRNLTLARSSTVMRLIEERLLQNHFM